MDREIDEQLLTAYVLGEVDAATAAAVERRLAADPGARAMAEEIRAAAAAVAAAVGEDVGVRFDRAVAGPVVPRVSKWWARAAMGLAASVVVGGILTAVGVTKRDLRPALAIQERSTIPMTRPAAPAQGGWSGSGAQPQAQARGTSYSYANPFPSSTGVGSGYKLNNSLSPDVAVSANPDVDAKQYKWDSIAVNGPTPALAPARPAIEGKDKVTADLDLGGGRERRFLVEELQAGRSVPAQQEQQQPPAGGAVYSRGFAMSESYGLSVRGSRVDLGERLEQEAAAPGDVYRGPVEHNTEAYDRIEENAFLDVLQNPLSTFSADVDTASYANARRFIEGGRRPPADAVRVEEFLNYFPYDYAPPASGKDPFAAHLEVAECPWNSGHRLVRVGIKGKVVAEEERPAANLVFLIDVSGSMNTANKLPLVKQSLKMLAKRLRPQDRVAMVVYAGNSGLVLPSTSAGERETVERAIENLQAGGSTNGAAGIELAYQTAQSSFIKDGTNRVILCTDGDWNVGVTDQGALTRLIEEKAKGGTFLTVLGFGMGNLKDSTMVKLADKGNGHYGYVDSPAEAKKLLVDGLAGTLVAIAKDVKLQVEFNPAKVSSYRLIGYEKRKLAKEDFNDDTKDAGEIGAGHTVTAMYEVVPAGVAAPSSQPAVDELKYRPAANAERVAQPAAGEGELLTVKIRYKQPDGDASTKLEFPLVDGGASFAKASTDFKFAAAVAEYAMILRDSKHKGTAMLGAVVELAEDAMGTDPGGYRKEFISLVKRTQAMGVK